MLKRDSSRPVLAWPLRRRPLPDDAGYIPFLWEGKFEQGFLDEYGPAQVGLGPPFTSKDRTVYDLANNTCGSHQVGKGEGSFLSLPVAARGLIPPIYRRALFGHRATPWPVPLARRQVGSTAGGTRASDKKIKPRRRKCFHRSRQLSVCHLRLNFMARIRIRNHPSKARNRLRQQENGV